MPNITDPNIARIMERVDHIAKRLDELQPFASTLVALHADHQQLASAIKHLSTEAGIQRQALHELDKRVVGLEKWQKGLVWFTGVALSMMMWLGGYAKQFIDSLEENNRNTQRRITTMEFIINSPNLERAMEPERPVASGSK
jgi:hypothetical protein